MPIFSRKEKNPGRIFEMWKYNSWGNNIFWRDYEKKDVCGHATPVPEIGDHLHCEMQSGNIAVFEFTDVNRMTDPRDQFFSKVKFLHYL